MKRMNLFVSIFAIICIQNTYTKLMSSHRVRLTPRSSSRAEIFVYNNSSVPLYLKGLSNNSGGICLWRPTTDSKYKSSKDRINWDVNWDWVCQRHSNGSVSIASGEVVGLASFDLDGGGNLKTKEIFTPGPDAYKKTKVNSPIFKLWSTGDTTSWKSPSVSHKGKSTSLNKNGAWIFTDHGVFYDTLPKLGNRTQGT